ncbi:MAG: OmpA family protein [Bacteroidetes bacterium]|nr:MAG: OmpA family protein [Bacteroidota bacterium]
MNNTLMKNVVCALFFLASSAILPAQDRRLMPEWWFGAGAGANINWHSASITRPNNTFVPFLTPFEKASGVGLWAAPMLEYRPDPVWGGIITLGFDGRGGSFDDVTDASGGPYKLSTSMNYLSLEPSLRISPFEYPLYFFVGPRLGFNVAKTFEYESQGVTVEGEWDGARGTVISAQIGAGYDIPLNSRDADWLTDISPFVSFHFGQGPRSSESWSLTTLRLGAMVKFGNTEFIKSKVERDVQFSVRAPQLIPTERKVKETLPLRNYVFFDEGSTNIPSRYAQLTTTDAAAFNEESLLEPKPKDLTGRSSRQQTVYYNVLNILGDRMRKDPSATVRLSGASLQGAENGKAMAEAIKLYLMNTFKIDASRIATAGTKKPEVPSFQTGGTREVEIVQVEDRRVDITSDSPQLLKPVQIVSLQEDPFDSDILFNIDDADGALASWSLDVTDTKGATKHFGPFTAGEQRIPGKQILAGASEGQYNIVMMGTTTSDQTIRKEKTIRLALADKPEDELGLRFSILFEFDQSKTVSTYERFLSETVAPLVPDGASVIIHGHTDVVGEEQHNLTLSRDRAQQTMTVLERELKKAGKTRVRFDTYGFGEDARRAPFDNNMPEQRFYNRTVIIDIVPEG